MPDNPRKLDHPASHIFIDRFSPRSFTGETVDEATLLTCFEAARWSPSSYNSQPWRFVYAVKGTPEFERLFGLLAEANQSWCKNASALIVVCSKTMMKVPGKDEEVPSRTHSFDAGAGWMGFALQASLMNWHAHGMVGFDYDRAKSELNVPDGHQVEMAIAFGRLGPPDALPERYRPGEIPNGRRPIAEAVFKGSFPG